MAVGASRRIRQLVLGPQGEALGKAHPALDPAPARDGPSPLPMLTLVLAGPELAVNVGFVARAMACYGLRDLRIVGSPGIATDGAARKTGKSALDILEAARYFPSLDLAIADCGGAYGFTRRARDPAQKVGELA